MFQTHLVLSNAALESAIPPRTPVVHCTGESPRNLDLGKKNGFREAVYYLYHRNQNLRTQSPVAVMLNLAHFLAKHHLPLSLVINLTLSTVCSG